MSVQTTVLTPISAGFGRIHAAQALVSVKPLTATMPSRRSTPTAMAGRIFQLCPRQSECVRRRRAEETRSRRVEIFQ
jgi:hypothetical protein